jgi:cysteinyl-tRNA synthetase
MASRLNKADGTAERAREKGALLAAGQVLGILQMSPEAWFRWTRSDGAGLPDDAVQDLVDRRWAARQARDFATADRLRGELSEAGIMLEDSATGTQWRRSS